jgi:transposase-like protein
MPTRDPRSPFNRPRWTEQEARDAIAALERSGKPVSVFAAEHGLDAQRLYAWRRRLGGAEATTFRELVVRRPSQIAIVDGDGTFEIVLPSGVVVRVRRTRPSQGRPWPASGLGAGPSWGACWTA